MAGSSRGGGGIPCPNRTIIIPQGTIDPEQNTVIHVPRNFDTSAPLLVTPPRRQGGPLSVQLLPDFQDRSQTRGGPVQTQAFSMEAPDGINQQAMDRIFWDANASACDYSTMQDTLREDTVASKEPQFEEEAIVQGTFVEAPYLEDHVIEQDFLKLAESYEIKEKIHHDSLKYVAGFVAYKFKHKYRLGSPTESYQRHAEPDCLQTISRGSLLYPNE
nr:unnamed protein product [Callosobruchus analis]